jgi:hypothetical protein
MISFSFYFSRKDKMESKYGVEIIRGWLSKKGHLYKGFFYIWSKMVVSEAKVTELPSRHVE